MSLFSDASYHKRPGDESEESCNRRDTLPSPDRLKWRIENMRLVVFGLWLAFAVLVIDIIHEMNGW